jgi:thymidylate synthase (FAD)
MPKAKLISVTPNYLDVLKVACGKPYGNNIGLKSIQKIIESGHLSVLEHCYASFDVECSVRVLGQLTRHRHLSFTVKSSRGSEFYDVAEPKGLPFVYSYVDLTEYRNAIDAGVPYEDAAYLLPQGAITSMVISGNFRAWYEYLPKRLCKRAMQEHRDLANLIHLELANACPEIFERSFMNCADCKERSCQFK